MSKATDKQWRVQVRRSRAHKWVNKGLFETRIAARVDCENRRIGWPPYQNEFPLGYGRTRVIPYVKAKKGQGK